jgi:16S rRNA (adenine1518-N6/adenine1519-N6)-dimethyltransferase
MNADSPAEIRALLRERGIALKKRWGQNFLVNRGLRSRLLEALSPQPHELVWEIGAGLGSMTGELLERSRGVVAFEVDRGLCRYLKERFSTCPSLVLVEGDFLATWRGAADSYGVPDAILGNLPYRSASLIIARIIEGGLSPRAMVVTVQRELAQRMASPPGVKSYSSFSVLCQACFEVSVLGDAQPGSFYPAPQVASSMVELRPRADAPRGEVLAALSALSRSLFAARRKTIRNNLRGAGEALGFGPRRLAAALERAGIDQQARAEQLSPETLARLAVELTGPASP